MLQNAAPKWDGVLHGNAPASHAAQTRSDLTVIVAPPVSCRRAVISMRQTIRQNLFSFCSPSSPSSTKLTNAFRRYFPIAARSPGADAQPAVLLPILFRIRCVSIPSWLVADHCGSRRRGLLLVGERHRHALRSAGYVLLELNMNDTEKWEPVCPDKSCTNKNLRGRWLINKIPSRFRCGSN